MHSLLSPQSSAIPFQKILLHFTCAYDSSGIKRRQAGTQAGERTALLKPLNVRLVLH